MAKIVQSNFLLQLTRVASPFLADSMHGSYPDQTLFGALIISISQWKILLCTAVSQRIVLV